MTAYEHLIEKLQYNLWANQQFGDWLLSIPEIMYSAQVNNSFPSLRTTWNHIQKAETGWWKKMRGEKGSLFPEFNNTDSCEIQVKELIRQSVTLVNYCSTFSEEHWEDKVEYLSGDQKYSPSRRQVVEHILNHSNYHRGQLITIAYQLSLSNLPSTDFIKYLRDPINDTKDVFSPNYWEHRYNNQQDRWDVGYITPPLKRIIDSIKNKSSKILIPGAGQAHAAEYAFNQGFKNVYICDWAPAALIRIKELIPEFPKEQYLCQDYFTIDEKFDFIIEQTFFCALPPSKRTLYIEKSATFLQPEGILIGLLFGIQFPKAGPPFGGDEAEYRKLFKSHFRFECLETCTDSIPSRLGNELYFRAQKI